MPDDYVGLVLIYDKSYIRMEGFEIRNYKTNTRNRNPVGIRVIGAGSHIEIVGNEVHHIESNAAPLWNAADQFWDGRDAHGIAVHGINSVTPLSDILIQGNTVRNNILGSSEAVVINGNVDGFTVKDNVVHDNDNIGIDAIGYEGTAEEVGGDATYDFARNGLIQNNVVYRNSSFSNPSYFNQAKTDSEYLAGGIYVDGGSDIVIESNWMYSNDIGVEAASEHEGKCTCNIVVRNNFIANSNYVGLAFGGYDAEPGPHRR